MKFSIVVPIYKVENYLRECVDSILGQTFEDYEIILVDDGSPDSCPIICDEYAKKDNRIKVIHQINSGLACARNSGIKAAAGEYLICIDSDDYLKNNTILQKIAKKTLGQTDVVLFGFQKFFESSKTFGYTEVPVLNYKCSTLDMLNQVLSTDTYCGTAWTKAVRLELLKENNIEFRPGMISEDIDWYLNLLCYAKTFDSINEVAIIYRQRDSSISHSPKINSLTDNLWILETWPRRFHELVDDERVVHNLYSILAYYYANDLILYTSYPSRTVRSYKSRLKASAYLFQYSKTSRSLTVKRFYKIFGFGITILVLRILAKLKTRK